MEVTGGGVRHKPVNSFMVRQFAGVTRMLLVAITRLFSGACLRPGAMAHLERHAAGACIYFANHNSLADFLVLWTVMPRHMRQRARPVAAADYWGRSPWRRFLARDVFNAVLIERGEQGDAGDSRLGFAAMVHALRQGDSLILFPEGTRNTGDALLQPFKPGLYLLAKACPTTALVPVWLDQTRRALPKGAMLPTPALCTVNVGPALMWAPYEPCEAVLRRAQSAVLGLQQHVPAPARRRDDRVKDARAA